MLRIHRRKAGLKTLNLHSRMNQPLVFVICLGYQIAENVSEKVMLERRQIQSAELGMFHGANWTAPDEQECILLSHTLPIKEGKCILIIISTVDRIHCNCKRVIFWIFGSLGL